MSVRTIASRLTVSSKAAQMFLPVIVRDSALGCCYGLLPKELQGTAYISFASSGVIFKLETLLEAVSDRFLVDGK